MQRNYLQVKQFLEEKFPELRGNITGGNKAPPQFAVYMMNVVSFLHLITIAFFFMGDNLWNIIGVTQPPSWYYTCKQYPLQTLVTIFLVIPSIGQKFVTTGAFEIMCNDQVLFSKIQTGRFPNGADLIDVFKNFGLVEAT